MIPSNLITLSVERNRNKNVTRLTVCNGTHHFVIIPGGRDQNSVCNGEACKEEIQDFPLDVISQLTRDQQLDLHIGREVPSGKILAVNKGGHFVKKSGAWAPWSDFENGVLLADREYVIFKDELCNPLRLSLIYNLSGNTTYISKYSFWYSKPLKQLFIKRKTKKWQRKIVKLGLREVMVNPEEIVFDEEINILRAKREKLAKYPQTPRVVEALQLIDETLAMIPALPQAEIEAHADDIAIYELDEVRRIRDTMVMRLEANQQTWADIAKIEQQNAPLLDT